MQRGIVKGGSALSAAALARETAISVAINCTMSTAFYLLLFHDVEPVPIWGLGNYAFDFGPQTFMIALMGTMVPGLITARALKYQGCARAIIGRALRFALVAVLIGVAATCASLWMLGIESLGFRQGLIAKLAYGATLAAIVTPLFLRTQLHPTGHDSHD